MKKARDEAGLTYLIPMTSVLDFRRQLAAIGRELDHHLLPKIALMIFPKMLIVRSQGLEMVHWGDGVRVRSALFPLEAPRRDHDARLASPAGFANATFTEA